MSVTSGKSHSGCSSCAQRALPRQRKPGAAGRKDAAPQGEPAGQRPTHLVRVFDRLPTPLDAAVGRHQDEEWPSRGFPHLEGLGVKGLLQGLHAEEVLELEVAGRGAALAELLDEALEAEADALTRQEVALLDLSPHVLRQEGLVAGGKGKGRRRRRRRQRIRSTSTLESVISTEVQEKRGSVSVITKHYDIFT